MIDRILVTGATGNIGSALVRLLRLEGVDTVAASRRPASDSHAAVRFSFTDPATHAPALEGVTRVFLVRPPELSHVERDIEPFLDAAAKAGLRQVVFLSLQGVERNPFVPHHAIERALRERSMPSTMLRAGFFMQNLSTTHARDIRERGEIYLPAGMGRTAFIDGRDIAAVAQVTLRGDIHVGAEYELTGPQALTYAEIAATLSRVLGRAITYRPASVPGFFVRSIRHGTPWAFAGVMTALYTVARLGKAGRLTDDTARLLGRTPVPFEQFAADHREAWQTSPDRPGASRAD